MPVHVVKPGECLSVIAARHGFADYKTLYHHPANAGLKRRRPNPNLIYPGDEVVIPARTEKTTEVAAGKAHTFTVRRPEKVLRVVLQKHDGTALGGEAGILSIGDRKVRVTSDGGGRIEQPMPIDARQATLRIAGRVLELHFGHLNPIGDAPDAGVTGVKGRLRNLGYDVTDGADGFDDSTRAALALFQHDHQLPVTGILDDVTTAALTSAHGC